MPIMIRSYLNNPLDLERYSNNPPKDERYFDNPCGCGDVLILLLIKDICKEIIL